MIILSKAKPDHETKGAAGLLFSTTLLVLVACGSAPPSPDISANLTADLENGKRLFKDEKLGDSRNNKSCASCHRRGEGLERADRPVFRSFFGLRKRDLPDVINWCIAEPMDGTPISRDSQAMADLAAYVRTFDQSRQP